MWRHSWSQSECCVVLSLELRSSRHCLGSICRKCLPGPLSWRWDVAPVLCITWTLTQPRVTTSARVLKTTRLPCFNRSCCKIRVFHPYLMARSPRCGPVTPHWLSMAMPVGMTALWWVICYPSRLIPLPPSEMLDWLFICALVRAEHIRKKVPGSRPWAQVPPAVCKH